MHRILLNASLQPELEQGDARLEHSSISRSHRSPLYPVE